LVRQEFCDEKLRSLQSAVPNKTLQVMQAYFSVFGLSIICLKKSIAILTSRQASREKAEWRA
jgi:hypothetical protein